MQINLGQCLPKETDDVISSANRSEDKQGQKYAHVIKINFLWPQGPPPRFSDSTQRDEQRLTIHRQGYAGSGNGEQGTWDDSRDKNGPRCQNRT